MKQKYIKYLIIPLVFLIGINLLRFFVGLYPSIITQIGLNELLTMVYFEGLAHFFSLIIIIMILFDIKKFKHINTINLIVVLLAILLDYSIGSLFFVLLSFFSENEE